MLFQNKNKSITVKINYREEKLVAHLKFNISTIIDNSILLSKWSKLILGDELNIETSWTKLRRGIKLFVVS